MKIAYLCLFVTLLFPACAAQASDGLPPEVNEALSSTGISASSLSVTLTPVYGEGRAAIRWEGSVPRSPASVMKTVTAAAAMDLLGAGKVWKTEFLSASLPTGGTVPALYIRASGAPWLPASRFREALMALRAVGVSTITGPVVLDSSVFAEPEADPAEFDGHPDRPYNQGHDPLGLALQSVTFSFVPLPGESAAAVLHDPDLAGYSFPLRVPLSYAESVCPPNLTATLRPETEPGRISFRGSYPMACGEGSWSAVPWPVVGGAAIFDEEAMRAGWTALDGVWTGKWMKGKAPDGAQVLYTLTSKPLSLMIRDMNKNSINPIARNLFLGISAGTPGGATRLASRNAVTQWMASQGIPTEGFLIDNGSGLSRTARISTDQLTGVLLAAGKKPWSPEFMSSLPIAGVDGTMKRRGLEEGGAHIKTGYIRGVRSVAGYVRSASGTLYAVSAIVNDPNALGAKPVLDAVLNYAASDGAAEASSPLPSAR